MSIGQRAFINVKILFVEDKTSVRGLFESQAKDTYSVTRLESVSCTNELL